MNITFLGTGGGVPSVNRNLCSSALQVGPEILLFDCGEGTQRQFMRSNISFMKVSAVFVTHFHGDHFLGLPGLVQSMSFNGRTDSLHIYGPEGVIGITDRIVNLGYFAAGFDILVSELGDGSMAPFDGYKVSAVEVDHSVPCLGYVFKEDDRPGRFLVDKARGLGVPEGPLFSRLQKGEEIEIDGKVIAPEMVLGPPRMGRKVVFSGDTRPCDSLIRAAKGADVLVHEATVDSSLEEKAREYGHSTAREAAEVARSAGVRALYLNHISNRYDDGSVLERDAGEVFPGAVVCEDLMRVVVRSRDNFLKAGIGEATS